ncbi:MAG: radical SAM protein [bacterium]
MKVFVKGLNACLQRRFDVDRYKRYVMDCGHELVNEPDIADMILLWTCSFRQDFCDNSLSFVDKYAERFGEDKIVLCGCLPAINKEILNERYSGRYFKWSEEEKGLEETFVKPGSKKPDILRTVAEGNITTDIHKYRDENPDKNSSYYDQFIKLYISEGCPYECSFCAEKLAFPPYRSFPMEHILNECREILKNSNTKKVVFIADSVGSYGLDIGSSLEELITSILGIEDGVTIGLMNVHPVDFLEYKDYLAGLIKTKKLIHLSVPIQSATDRILKLMNRPYNKAHLEEIFGTLRELDFKELETHQIVGIPSETFEEFMETVEFFIRYKPKYVMASGYMESSFMESSKLKGKLSNEEIARRLVIVADELNRNNIICNYDNCKYFKDTIRRISSLT